MILDPRPQGRACGVELTEEAWAGASAVGRTLAEAQVLLEQAGVKVLEVVSTQPPGRAPEGPLRVVAERRCADGVRLVVAPSVALLGAENGQTRA